MGTLVPVQWLIDYLEADRSLAEFLDDFPSVTGSQAIAVLEQAKYDIDSLMPPMPAVRDAFRDVEPARIIELVEQRCQTQCNVAGVAHRADDVFGPRVRSMYACALLGMKMIT